MKKSILVVGMAVMILTFGMVAVGCASNPSSVDTQQFVGVWLQDLKATVNEITLQPDGNGSWTIYRAGEQPSTFDVRLIDGGRRLTDGTNSPPIRLNNGKLILRLNDQDRTFSKAQPVEVSDSVWVQANNAFEITYTFAKDGTYKIEYGGLAISVPGSQLKNRLDELSKAGIDGTGTYTVSDHYVILKPKGGAYIVGNPINDVFSIQKAETYTLVFVNGNELFYGYYYKKK